jgi:hypothetical protein
MKARPAHIALGVLNLLNAALPVWSVVALAGSPQRLENEWAVVIALAAGGMIGLGVCLLAYPTQARRAAVVAVLLIVLHAVMVLPIGSSDTQSMGGGLLIIFGLVGSAVFGIVPVVTLLVISTRKA